MNNSTEAIRKILVHEGGYVNHPKDPGAATNRGVTIGTLRRLGMDLNGDGKVDVTDLKRLTEADAVKIYKRFYWDKVEADALPDGVDYTVADFAVNSGPSRAAKYLQAALGVERDGDVGPITIRAAHAADPIKLINTINDDRLAFMQRLEHWPHFKRGWTRRVAGVRATSLEWAKEAYRPQYVDHAPEPAKQPAKVGFLASIAASVAALVAFFNSIFGKGKP